MFQRIAVALSIVVGSSLPLFAQGGVGAISGTVTDETGGALPGATVTLAGDQVTLGSNQITISDSRGDYEFSRLVPGTYSVTAELPGFQSVRQPNIVVNADTSARADFRLAVGQFQETLIVSGAAPLLDTRSAARQTIMSRQEIESLPNRADVWSMARAVPGVIVSKLDTGSTQSFENSTTIVRGSSTENKYNFDGMDVSSVSGQGTIPNIYPDPFLFEEANYQVGAGSAESSSGGLTINMVTRTGTNVLHGGAKFNVTPPAFARSRNYTDELRRQLLASVPPLVLAVNPNIDPNADITRMTDVGGWIGGPLVRDRLWFMYSAHDQRLDQYRLGSYNPDGTPVIDDNVLWNLAGKVSWAVGKAAQLSFFNDVQYKLIGHRGGGLFGDSVARAYNWKYPVVYQAKYTVPISNRMALDVSYNAFRSDDIFTPRPEVKNGDVATFDTVTQVNGVALATGYQDFWMNRHQARASLSWSIPGHDFKTGYEYIRGARSQRNWSLSGMRANFANGVPTSVNTYLLPVPTSTERYPQDEIPFAFEFRDALHGAFVQDRWALGRHFVLNLGVRIDTDESWQLPVCQPVTLFSAGGPCYDRIDAPSFVDVIPRFSLVYDPIGQGKTAIKVSANRYAQPISVSVITRLNPVTNPSDQRQWLAQSQCNNPGVLGCDRNGDRIPQISELGPSPGYVFAGVNARYADGLERPMADEYSLEFQHELPMGVVFTASVADRRTKFDIGSTNTAAPLSSWGSPIPVTEVVSGQRVDVWRRGTTASANLFFNSDEFATHYRGVDLFVTKRMGDHWSANGGASYGKVTNTTILTGSQTDPHFANNRFNRDVISPDDRPWTYRFSGVYEAPYGLIVSGSWLFQEGAPETTTVLVTNQTITLPQGNQSVIVAPPGDVRYPNAAALDLNVRRRFRFGSTTITPRLEIFNLTNEATITAWVTQMGPTYHRPSAIQRGRLTKLEVGIEF